MCLRILFARSLHDVIVGIWGFSCRRMVTTELDDGWGDGGGSYGQDLDGSLRLEGYWYWYWYFNM